MTNQLAIAVTTAAFQDRIAGCVSAEIDGAVVATTRPDSKKQTEAGVNVFLYEVSANPFLRNDVPHNDPIGRGLVPLAALDLHYLLTFNGHDNTLEAQRLLGAVIADLAERPMLSAHELRDAVATRPHLAGGAAAADAEPIVLTPLDMSLEELSRLWSVLLHEPYTLSVPYQASVLLLRPLGAVPARPVSDIKVATDTHDQTTP